MKKALLLALTVITITGCTKAPEDWTTAHVGTYNGVTVCGSNVINSFLVVQRVDENHFIADGALDYTMTSKNDFILPQQTRLGTVFSGTGYFQANTIRITFTQTQNGTVHLCQFDGTR